MQLLDQLIDLVKKSPARIVVCEADDARILAAAHLANQQGIAKMILVGDTSRIQETARRLQLDIHDLSIEDPALSEKRPELARALVKRRASKGMNEEKAQAALNDPLCFATMLVHCEYADGSVAGAVYSTADVVRSALQLIGKAPGVTLVSSFFLMLLNKEHHPIQKGIIFSDCGLVVDPSEEELAAIAIAAVQSARLLLQTEPRVAMLSFSTSNSATHPAVTKVVRAAQRVKAAIPTLAIDEDVQFDAAIIPEIAARKLKNSAVNGLANVFIFPNLEAGNIGYKIAERLGGVTAIGPLLQGLDKPANDLSRGCSTEDVFYVIAITSLQAQTRHRS
ncbi:phosphate acetyltransferase [Paenalcaligenes niemegkensis]|uniref:phosphate acetyltransferase n=1 Tax=Paenalcaligenes niemegkensis TaxID=2895469 RepID=UPI001EE8AC29|nr:phosphate acetyltransferase [Paenalcaligenes niemegkensis]MCQ9615721.1 phosphate acetyltransferase [Paenalcaligenes niemegkensis]